MEGLLVSGGTPPRRSRLAGRFGAFDLICAADSGLDTLRAWDLAPHLIVGDMDSLSDPALLDAYPGAQVMVFDRKKDATDTELGLRALADRGASRIVLAGGGGGRLDHLLAIRCLFERPLRPVEWHTGAEAVLLVESDSCLEFDARRGETVSVFPLAGGSRGMKSEGLEWRLDGLVWGPGDFGVSNEASGGRVTIIAGQGDLLVLRLLDPGMMP